MRRAAQATVEAVGSIDAILNFAGVIKGGPLVEMDDLLRDNRFADVLAPEREAISA